VSRVLPPSQLAAALQGGALALFPTDTLPALAAAPAHAASLWGCKARPQHKPLILMGADLEQLVAFLGLPWSEAWLGQARRSWPGAVTLVLPLSGPVTQRLHPGGTSLGLRVPACAQAQELLRLSGPLATTSANRSGEPAAADATEAAAIFPDLPLLGPLPWPRGSGVASTVMAWEPQGAGSADWRLLRAGASLPMEEPGPGC
jgi:L-threonylcarbamoyladenylate synthase